MQLPRNRHKDSIAAFERLCFIMDDLREQCPWDKKQTFQTLRNLTIEETYELADAILENNGADIKEEIGDLMLHMVFYARLGEEAGVFSLAEALNAICEKLIVRHPHIYGDVNVQNAEEVKQNWEKIKLQSGKKQVLGGVPSSLPALVKAFRLQEKTAQVGFEWPDKEQVWDKVEEEISELKAAVSENMPSEDIEEELGDVLFSLVNYARFIHVDPETALEKVNKKFKRRFEYIEQSAGDTLLTMTLEEMDRLWEEAKMMERR